MMKAKKLGGSLSYGSLSYGCLFFTIFIFTSLIFSNCARKKEKKQLVVVKDEFEKVEEFVLDEKTGQELAKNQILIYIVGNSKSELEEKKAKVSEFLKAKKGEFSVLGEIEFLSKKEKVGVLLQAKVPAGTPEEIKQIVLELRNFDVSIRAFPNMRMRPNAVLDGRIPLDPLFDSWEETPGGNNWHFEAVNMPGLWKMETEGKVPVAVIEFGIRKHEDLAYDLRRGVDGEGADWAQNHGVSVLGVLGAVGNNSKGIAGTIWRGDIRAYLIDGTLSSLIQSIVFALEDEAKVILFAGGLEWGSVNPEGNPEAEEILEYHREIFSVVFQYIRYYDGLFVQSAGNEGRDARYAGVGASVKDLFPHNILLVGSTNILGKISSFSNRGSLVDIYLPGESIFTTCWGSSNDTGYCLRSGTSYSAAMGAGVAVLLGSINGDLRSGEIKEMILRGVRMEGEGENARYVIDFSISGDLAILSRSGNLDLGVRIPELGDIVPMPWMPVEREAFVEIGNLGPKAVECAVYDDTTVDGDPAYKAPKCPDNVEGCSSCGLLDGNGNVSGYPEPNQPNTLYGLVQDLPGTGAYAPVRTISIQVDSMAESGFIQSGPTATDRRNIKVTVRAWGNNPDQWIDVFYTSDANANPPIFELLGSYRYDCGASEGWEAPVVPGTVTCSRSGNETTISFLMTLPAVTPPRKMAMRARIRNSPTWRYRRAITINNTGTQVLTDYQVLITIDTQSLITAGKMKTDCGDIRFVDSDGRTMLSYWIESGCNTAATRIWVKVPSIPASSSRTIYVYYGNASATSASSAMNTFIPNVIYVMSGDCTNSTYCGHMDDHSEANVVRTFAPNLCTEYVDRIDWGSVCGNSGFNTSTRDSFYSRFRFLFIADVGGTYTIGIDSDDGSEAMISPGDRYGTYGSESASGYAGETVIVSWYGGHGVANSLTTYTGTISLSAGQGIWIDVIHTEWTGNEGIRLGIQKPGGSMRIVNATNFAGQIFARKYVSPEPTASIGVEESGEFTSFWRYRRAITINNTGTQVLTDYQVLITINTQSLITAGKMKTDCGDIRFVDSDGRTMLSYWIESGCNTAATRIWVKVPSIPASSSRTIYVYYGNASATSASSAMNTFIPNAIYVMSGDCTNSTYCGHMDNHSEANVVRTFAPNLCTKYVDRIDWGSVCDNSGFNTNTRDRFYSRFRFLFIADVGGTYTIGIDSDDGSEAMISPGDRYGTYGSESASGYAGETVIVSWYGGHRVANSLTTYTGTISLSAGQGIWIDVIHTEWTVTLGFSFEGIRLGIQKPGGSMRIVNATNFAGQIFARKYVSPEPTASIGVEESGEFTSFWRYRRAITINNTGTQVLTDYQVLITINTQSLITAGKMKTDCGDIRFVDSDGRTMLSYWIESGCNSTTTKIWVKVPSIPASSSRTIYVYYGNASATSASNPHATMFIYEDYTIPPMGFFAGSAIYSSTNKWVQLTPNSGNRTGYLYYPKVPKNPIGFYAKFYIWAGGGNGGDAMWLGAYDTDYTSTEEDRVNGGYHFTYDEYQDRICFTKSTSSNGAGIACASETTIDNSNWHLAEIYFWYDGSQARTRIYYDGALKVDASDTSVQSNVINGAGQIIFGGRTGGSYNFHRIGNGLLYVVKYTSPEPSTSIGAEEVLIEDNDDLVFTVQNPPSSFVCGVYDSNFKAPVCYGDGWCGTCNSVPCRDTTGDSAESPAGFYNCGGNEPNQPNTLFSQCQDTSENTADSLDEQIRRINIKSLAPSGKFEGGELVEASLLVACRSDDQIVIAYASGVTYSPTQLANWRYVTTISCPSGAPVTYWYNLHYTLRLDNVEGWHAVRAVLGRCPGCATQTDICPSMTFQDADDFVFYVKAKPPSSLPVCAVYDSYYKTPRCPAGASACSTCNLVKSRDGLSGTEEPNKPNTLFGSCSDDGPTTAQYLQTESIERIEIKDLSGSGTFQPGGQVEVSVLVYCDPVYPNYLTDYLVLLYSSNADADSPTFTRVLTATCTSAGYNLFRTNITLANVAGRHVVRAIFKQGAISSTDTCAGEGVLDDGDTDDLVFDVGIPQAPPDFKIEGIAPDSITLTWSDVLGETYYEIRWTDTYTPDYSKWQVISDNYSANSTWYLDSGLSGGAERCYAIRACSGSVCSDFVWDCTMVPTESARCAVFDPVWRVPRCDGGINRCSTCNLVLSRDSLARRQEINTPNAWYSSSCTDGGGGDYYSSRSVERIVLSTGASAFSTGNEISVRVRVFCGSTADYVHLYVSAGTSPISWGFVGSQACSGSNQFEDKTFSFTPSADNWYVIRAVVTGSTASTCPGGSQDEVDDVAVRVVEGARPPYNLSVTAYSTETITQYVVSFIDDSGNEDGFAIERTSDGSSWTRYEWWSDSTTKSGTGSRRIEFSLSPETRLCFRVASFKQNAGDSLTLSSWVGPKCVIGLKAPSHFNVDSAPNIRVMRFFWQDNSSYEVGQNFEWRLQSSSTYTQESVLGLEYYEKEFAEENVYCARITNWWNGNNSIPEEQGSYSVGYSSEKCFVAMASPSPLIAEVINIGGSDAIKLTWQDSSTQETGFTIEVNTGSGWGLLTTKAPNSTTHVHSSGLVAGTTYCYRVRAERTGFGSSPWSNSTCVRFGSPACSTIWGPIDLSGGIGGSITTSAVIDDSSVYVGTSTGYLISVDVMNGQIRWLKNLGSAVSSHLCASQEGQRTTIFVGTLDGKFHAVDSDGNLIGTQDLGGVVGGCAVKDGKVYLGTTTGWVFVLSKTLSILNSKQVSGAISTAPAIDAIRGSVYFVTESGKVYAFSLDLSDKWSITLTGAPVIRSSPGLGPKGDIYFGANDGKLYKVSPSGSVVWSYNIGSAIRSSPVIYTYGSQVTVFVGADNNYVYAISENITGTSASLLWSYSTGSAVRSSGALSQKSVFAGSGSTLYSISIGGGSLSCSVAVLGSITAPVKMKGQIVFLGTGGGRLYAISSVEPQSSYSWGDFGNGNGRILDAHPYRGFAVEKSSWPVSLGTGVGAEIWASPKLYDFDGDGKLEIVIATRGGQVYVLNSDGTVKTGWPKSTGNAIFGTSAIGDIDGDGLAEIVVGNDGGLVYAFDSAGNVKTGFPISVTCKVRFITLANIDSDPENEILFTALNPCNRIYAYDGNGTLKWYYEPGQLMASYPVVNGSGTSAEILITDTNGNVYKLNSSGNLISGWPINLGLSQWLSSPSVGDIDKDGTRDFVVGTTNPVTIYAYTLGGTSKWSLVLQDENGNNLIGYYPRHIVLADIDGDSNLEVIVTVLPYSSGNPGYIYVIDDNGVRMWFKKFSSSPSLAPLVGDFDYDGSQEIAVLTDKGWLYIFESDGTQAQGSPHFLGNNLVGFASLVFGDIDGDGRLDVVFGDKNGYVRVFELGKGTVNGKKEWYFRKNLRNNANYDEND